MTFSIGMRVRLSPHGLECLKTDHHRSVYNEYTKGTIVSMPLGYIRVRIDGVKVPYTFASAFWEEMK